MEIIAERWHLGYQAEVGPRRQTRTAEPNQLEGSNTMFTHTDLSALAISNALRNQGRRDISQRPSGSLLPGKILLSYFLPVLYHVLCSLTNVFPRVVLRSPAAVSPGVTGKVQTLRSSPHIYGIRICEGLALESVLLKTRCSASGTDTYILFWLV